MKSQFFKTLSVVAVATSMIFITSCNKTNLSPEKVIGSSGSSSTSLTAIPYTYAPTIYGVQTGGTGGHNLYTINPSSGLPLTTMPITFTGGGGISHGAVLGIAKSRGLQTGCLTVVSACSGTTQFYSFNFTTRVAVGLGSIFGSGYITDIEYNPTTNVLYGIKDNSH